MISGEGVGALFGQAAKDYDGARQRLVPCFQAFYGAALDAAQWAWPDTDAPLRVLDLGAGTGLLSAIFATAYPRATITLVDLSVEMLAQARVRFGGSERFQLVAADYAVPDIPEAMDGPDGSHERRGYHIIISGLSIHHLRTREKRALYRRCAGALVPGGALVNADQVAGASPALTAHLLARWRLDVREAGGSDAELAGADARMAADMPDTLVAQLRWLKDAGLRNVDCWYRSGMFAVMAGYR